MLPPAKAARFEQFLKKLKDERAASDRRDAHALMKQVMSDVEDGYEVPRGYGGERMHIYGLSSEFEWKDLEGDPCYWDDFKAVKHRVQIFNSGRIIIIQMRDENTVLLDKAGSKKGASE